MLDSRGTKILEGPSRVASVASRGSSDPPTEDTVWFLGTPPHHHHPGSYQTVLQHILSAEKAISGQLGLLQRQLSLPLECHLRGETQESELVNPCCFIFR